MRQYEVVYISFITSMKNKQKKNSSSALNVQTKEK